VRHAFLQACLILVAALLSAGVSASAFAANSATVTPSSSVYGATASSVTVTVNLTYSAALSALDFTLTTPSASGPWKAPSVSGANVPQTLPSPDDLGVGGLGFVYTTIPANTANFTFVLTYPAGMTGNKAVTFVAHFTDESSSAVSTITGGFTLVPAGTALAISVQPTGRSVGVGQAASFSVTPVGTGPFTYAWKKDGASLANGGSVAGADSATLTIANVQSAAAGLYSVVVANAGGSATSDAAQLAITTTAKVVGGGAVVAGGDDIRHPNGNFYDQVLLTGASATVTADNSQVTRISFIDLSDDIVQVEYSGPGSLTLVLDNATGPAAPVKYNQPGVTYMKGHASLIITGADENSHVSVFSVGRMTAYDPTGAYDITKAPGTGNDPALNGNSIFKSTETYDGLADIGLISIASTNGKFGGIRVANASFFRATGLTGISAPGVAVQGPTYLGDISADSTATGTLLFGSTTDVRVTGGDMLQLNNRAVQVDGITTITFTAGTKSGGQTLPAQTNRAVFRKNGVDVTTQIVR
jgi:hypothetical protein